ncbi:hypothetical protein N7456_010345 [Penicillium angulare]|uniref:ATPase, vacuolar ER assembly factor, Vma12 n=1 Tax=Penicillium angulare TaxID=116970 RepID=A0A9W9K643_9EURO|nr:hypothetical protein N7456_010345 [Penicillium angulare]
MVLLVATDRIRSALEAVSECKRGELDLPTAIDVNGPISHTQLLRLSKHLQNDSEYDPVSCGVPGTSPTILSALLRGTKVYVPPPPKKPEPTPEYLASKARLQALAEKQAYQRLLNPNYTPLPESTDHHINGQNGEEQEDTLTPSLVLNIFVSVVITGFAVYWALGSFYMPRILAQVFTSLTTSSASIHDRREGVGASQAVRVLISFIAALSVAVAESFLYGLYLGKVEEARRVERGRKEEKVVLGPVGDGDGDEDADGDKEGRVVGEKEEIWGKGVNGGMRRRVREKWEREQEGQKETVKVEVEVHEKNS